MLNVQVLGERVLVKVTKEAEKTTKSGLILAKTEKDLPQKGAILCVGAGCNKRVSVGNKIYFNKYAGTEVEEGLILNYADVLALIW